MIFRAVDFLTNFQNKTNLPVLKKNNFKIKRNIELKKKDFFGSKTAKIKHIPTKNNKKSLILLHGLEFYDRQLDKFD